MANSKRSREWMGVRWKNQSLPQRCACAALGPQCSSQTKGKGKALRRQKLNLMYIKSLFLVWAGKKLLAGLFFQFFLC